MRPRLTKTGLVTRLQTEAQILRLHHWGLASPWISKFDIFLLHF